MSVQTKEYLKTKFEKGDKPTQEDFIDLIDTLNDNPMTAAGDIIIGGTSGAPTRLAKGTDGQVLTLASGNPVWVDRDIDWANPISVTTTTTLTIGKHHVCSGTAADYTVTLPAVSGNAGKLISVEMSGALTKLVTLGGNASELIDGAANRVMWANETAVLLCDGAQWVKIGGKSIPMVAGISIVSTNQLFSASTWAKILCATAPYNYNADAISADTTNKRINIRRTGLYTVSYQVAYSMNNATAGLSHASICKNGSFVDGGTVIASRLASNFVVAHRSMPLFCAEGDYLELFGYFLGGSFTTTTVYNTASPMTTMQINEIIQH